MSPLAVAIAIIVVATLLLRHLRQWRSISSLANAGFMWPLLGHAHIFFNVAPENILTVLQGLAARDPKGRKVAGFLGHQLMIFVFHPEPAETILASNQHISKSRDYGPMLPWLGTGLLISTGNKWRQRRKLLTPAFHFKILEDSMRIFNKNGGILAKLLLQDSENGSKALDLFPYLCRCTLDIILESAMGKSLDLQNDRNSDYAQSISDMVHIMQYRQKSPWLWPDWIYNLTPTKGEQDKHLKVLHGFTRSVIREKREELKEKNVVAEEKKRLAFLDLLLTVRTAEGEGLSDKDLQEEVDTFMFEGHDTTACALSWALLLLANHPEVQDKIVEEQREIFGDDMDVDVEQEQLGRMRYLECCVKEALRLYPSVPLYGRELEEDAVMDGQTLSKGTTVVIAPMLLHRNPKVWQDPDVFRPERFLAGSSAEKERHPYAYVPFSAGPRNCIGQRFALMEEKAVLSKLLRKVEVVAGDKVEDVMPVIEIITRPKGGIKAFFRPRVFKSSDC